MAGGRVKKGLLAGIATFMFGVGANAQDVEAVDEVGSSVANELSGFLGDFLDMPPLLRIPQGEEIRVLVNRDLVIR